jgi:hypothetical protein
MRRLPVRFGFIRCSVGLYDCRKTLMDIGRYADAPELIGGLGLAAVFDAYDRS